MSLDSGHKVIPLSDEENAEQLEIFKGYTEGLIQLDPGRWFFTSPFTKFANKYYNFKFRPTDVIIITFPKCGTTWMQEIIWTMVNNKDLNHPLAILPSSNRVPFFELDFIMDSKNSPPPSSKASLMSIFGMMCPGKKVEDGIFFQLSEAVPDPRVIKTHLPFTLLSKDMLDICKVIFVARDPKDVCVSYHHHSRIIKAHDYKGTFDQFVNLFVEDKLLYSSYWEILKEAFEREKNPNLHICYYEDLKKNTKAEYQKLNDFLKTELTEEQVDKIIEYTSFNVMKERENTMFETDDGEESIMNDDIINVAGGFFRKGETGDWKNKLTPQQAAKINEWTAKNAKTLNRKIRYCSS